MPLLNSPWLDVLRHKILLASATAAAPAALHQQRTSPCCSGSYVAALGLILGAGVRLFVQLVQSRLRDLGVGCLVLRPGHTRVHEHFCLLTARTSCIQWQIAVGSAVNVALYFGPGTHQYSARSFVWGLSLQRAGASGCDHGVAAPAIKHLYLHPGKAGA